jgi:hypothetical protein
VDAVILRGWQGSCGYGVESMQRDDRQRVWCRTKLRMRLGYRINNSEEEVWALARERHVRRCIVLCVCMVSREFARVT